MLGLTASYALANDKAVQGLGSKAATKAVIIATGGTDFPTLHQDQVNPIKLNFMFSRKTR